MSDLPIGQALRDARKSVNKSQRDVAKQCGKLRNYISRIEGGKAMPHADSFVKICEGIGIEPWRVLRYACKLKKKMEESDGRTTQGT